MRFRLSLGPMAAKTANTMGLAFHRNRRRYDDADQNLSPFRRENKDDTGLSAGERNRLPYSSTSLGVQSCSKT